MFLSDHSKYFVLKLIFCLYFVSIEGKMYERHAEVICDCSVMKIMSPVHRLLYKYSAFLKFVFSFTLLFKSFRLVFERRLITLTKPACIDQ